MRRIDYTCNVFRFTNKQDKEIIKIMIEDITNDKQLNRIYNEIYNYRSYMWNKYLKIGK